MGNRRTFTFYCLLAFCLAALLGCGKKADENKPVSEVKAEADKMSVDKLRSMAVKYKDAIVAKQDEIEKFTGKLKDIPITEKLGTEAKGLTSFRADSTVCLRCLTILPEPSTPLLLGLGAVMLRRKR